LRQSIGQDGSGRSRSDNDVVKSHCARFFLTVDQLGSNPLSAGGSSHEQTG
jgi:hypothetical protein